MKNPVLCPSIEAQSNYDTVLLVPAISAKIF